MDVFYIVLVPGIVRINFRDTYPQYIGPPTVYRNTNSPTPQTRVSRHIQPSSIWPLTVGAPWNACALEPMPRQALTRLRNHGRRSKPTRRVQRFQRRWTSCCADAATNPEQLTELLCLLPRHRRCSCCRPYPCSFFPKCSVTSRNARWCCIVWKALPITRECGDDFPTFSPIIG